MDSDFSNTGKKFGFRLFRYYTDSDSRYTRLLNHMDIDDWEK